MLSSPLLWEAAFGSMCWLLLTRQWEELVNECLRRGTELVQAVVDALFNLRATEDPDGPLVTLHEPTTRLPREKPISSSLSCFKVVLFLFVYSLISVVNILSCK